MKNSSVFVVITLLIFGLALVYFGVERTMPVVGADGADGYIRHIRLIPTRPPSATVIPMSTTPEGTDVYPPPGSATPQAYPPPDPTSTLTPASVENNWLVNGRFDVDYDPIDGGPDYRGSVEAWMQENGYWWDGALVGLHSPLPCSPSGTWYLQMDRDGLRLDLWPPPISADRIYQDVIVPFAHDTLYVHYEEAHHVGVSEIVLTIYGWTTESAWDVVYRQAGVRSPSGTGKCKDLLNPIYPPPAVYTDTIDVTGLNYPVYRVEIYGKLIGANDAVLWGDFRLWGER